MVLFKVVLNVVTSGGSLVTCCSEQIPTSYQAPAASIATDDVCISTGACTVNDGLRIRQFLETTYHLNCLLHIVHPDRWPAMEKYIQSQDFAWLRCSAAFQHPGWFSSWTDSGTAVQ